MLCDAAPHVTGTVVLMLAALLKTKYNIDSTRGLNKAIKTAIVDGATPLSSPEDAAKVPGGLVSAPDAINSLLNGGFLPASASSFPIYVVVAIIFTVVGMVLTCVLGLCVRTLWERREAQRRRLEEHKNLLQGRLRSDVLPVSTSASPPTTPPRASPPPLSPMSFHAEADVEPEHLSSTTPPPPPIVQTTVDVWRRGRPSTAPLVNHVEDLRTSPLSHRLSDWSPTDSPC